eukprot:CAMPEP_0118910538 /NCGR_PEP_ID=MMETSP1166-20130328/12635_1 /TAXON_ID=1104430 /ORGANISM="Chrysoreinhardia sp, Strain CCMP3193" /LENGTH=258 /DNA_ID=CAMNT_0006850005 /DNA_START=72 /DNA_END=844 /DNA_ORIENTATION=-
MNEDGLTNWLDGGDAIDTSEDGHFDADGFVDLDSDGPDEGCCVVVVRVVTTGVVGVAVVLVRRCDDGHDGVGDHGDGHRGSLGDAHVVKMAVPALARFVGVCVVRREDDDDQERDGDDGDGSQGLRRGVACRAALRGRGLAEADAPVEVVVVAGDGRLVVAAPDEPPAPRAGQVLAAGRAQRRPAVVAVRPAGAVGRHAILGGRLLAEPVVRRRTTVETLPHELRDVRPGQRQDQPQQHHLSPFRRPAATKTEDRAGP